MHSSISCWTVSFHSAWDNTANMSPASPHSYFHDLSAFPWHRRHLTPTMFLVLKANKKKIEVGNNWKQQTHLRVIKASVENLVTRSPWYQKENTHTKTLVGGVHSTKKGNPWVSASGEATCSIVRLVFSSTPTSWKIKTHTPPPRGGKNLQASTPHLHSASQPLLWPDLHLDFFGGVVEVQWWETSSRPFPVTTSSKFKISFLWSGRHSFI